MHVPELIFVAHKLDARNRVDWAIGKNLKLDRPSHFFDLVPKMEGFLTDSLQEKAANDIDECFLFPLSLSPVSFFLYGCSLCV